MAGTAACETAVVTIMLMLLEPFAALVAHFYREQECPTWWTGTGLELSEFDLLKDPLTWTRLIYQAILRSSEQKIGAGEDASFRQGLVFAPILNSKPPLAALKQHPRSNAGIQPQGRTDEREKEKDRARATYFVHTITCILPVSLVALASCKLASGMIDAVTVTPSAQIAIKALGNDTSKTTAFSGEVNMRLVQADSIRPGSLTVVRECAAGHFVGRHKMDQLAVPDLARPSPGRMNIIPVHRVENLDTTGGTDWLRRLKESLQFVNETKDQPWVPPWLLSPSKARLSLWLKRLRFNDQGIASVEATHERYKLWVAEGAHRAEIASIQKEISASSRTSNATRSGQQGPEAKSRGKRPASPATPSSSRTEALQGSGWSGGWSSSSWLATWEGDPARDDTAQWHHWQRPR